MRCSWQSQRVIIPLLAHWKSEMWMETSGYSGVGKSQHTHGRSKGRQWVFGASVFGEALLAQPVEKHHRSTAVALYCCDAYSSCSTCLERFKQFNCPPNQRPVFSHGNRRYGKVPICPPPRKKVLKTEFWAAPGATCLRLEKLTRVLEDGAEKHRFTICIFGLAPPPSRSFTSSSHPLETAG